MDVDAAVASAYAEWRGPEPNVSWWLPSWGSAPAPVYGITNHAASPTDEKTDQLIRARHRARFGNGERP